MLSDSPHILLIDDDDVDAEIVIRAFQQQKVANPLIHVHDGMEALNVLRGEGGRNRLPRPYIILLDLHMPRMNGIEFLRVLRQDPALKQSIVFVLTTSDREEDKSAAYGGQVAGYIVKSKIGHDFLEAIRLLDCYQVVVQMPI